MQPTQYRFHSNMAKDPVLVECLEGMCVGVVAGAAVGMHVCVGVGVALCIWV